LDKSSDFSSFTIDSNDVLEEIIETKIYSNISDLTEMTSLVQMCQYINRLEKMSNMYQPITYTLQSIKWLYPNAHMSCSSYVLLEEDKKNNLERYLVEISNQMKKIKYSLDSNVIKLLPNHPNEPPLTVQNVWKSLCQEHEDVIKRLRELVLDVCHDQQDANEIDKALKHKDQTKLKSDIEKLMQRLNDSNREQRQSKHHKALDSKVNENDGKQTFEPESIKKERQQQTPSFENEVTNNNQPIIPIEQEIKRKRNRQGPSPPSSETQPSDMASSPSTDEIINILLVGESGVGKSTFINAFVNYLKFKTFEQAESSTPVVLIPVSFLITTGNNFEEHTVKFGDSDSLNNEDFDHPGQSVTQNCKSYLFKLNRTKATKLCIIDTPGFGDTRGIDQDDLNMQHILEYISNLTHLNAVCFLLKPNTSQINKFFRTCLTQLLDLLGSDIRQNIIFCFTNARSTFYAPGDTAPLLKDILKSLAIPNIPFNKYNTFCFDNESFRYLVALQNSVTFDDQDKQEYEMSWSKSVDESKRLRDYIRKTLSACFTRDEHQSIKRAQLQITHMIRPMLEAMRNILRNILLSDMDASSKLIELKPKSVRDLVSTCLICKRDSMPIGNFWIVRDVPHKIHKKSCLCKCDLSHHIPIDYQLDYEYSDSSSNQNRIEMESKLNLLCSASVEFAYFLMHVACSSKDDPFWIGMTRIICEENDIGKDKNSDMNYQLAKKVREVLRSYEQQIETIDPNQQHNKLSNVYESIRDVYEYPAVQKQMIAVKKTQKRIMKLYEYEVPED
jgi:GTP-binding protein EngB required for normal cell division